MGIGVYSGSGNRLVHWDNIPVNTGVTGWPDLSASAAGGAVTLPAGYYYWAESVANGLSTQTVSGLNLPLSSQPEANRPWNTRGTVRTGTASASNLMVGGVLPATLGTLTAGFPISGSSTNLPVWIVEP